MKPITRRLLIALAFIAAAYLLHSTFDPAFLD
jgi:hypothetical protein